MREIRAAKEYAREIIERCPRMGETELETAYECLSSHLPLMESMMRGGEPPHKAVTRLLYARQEVSERLRKLRQGQSGGDDVQRLRTFFESCIDQLARENHALRERVLALERGGGARTSYGGNEKQDEAQREKQRDLELRLEVLENTVQGLSDAVLAERAAPPAFVAR